MSDQETFIGWLKREGIEFEVVQHPQVVAGNNIVRQAEVEVTTNDYRSGALFFRPDGSFKKFSAGAP